MTPTTFETAITTIFKGEFTDALTIKDSFNNAVPTGIEIGNIESLNFEATQLFDSTIAAVKQGTILLIDLIRNRQEIYQIAKQIRNLEIKEKQDVIDMEEGTEWHERNKLIRFFVSSDKGDQFDQEKEEAKIAESIAEKFANQLRNFEFFIDEYILTIGSASDQNFLLLVEEWKALKKLKESLIIAKKNIQLGQSKLKTSVRCSKGSRRVNNDRSKKHFSFAMNQLKKQINVYKPIYENLTEKVESKILQVRNQLLIN